MAGIPCDDNSSMVLAFFTEGNSFCLVLKLQRNESGFFFPPHFVLGIFLYLNV